MDEADWGHTLAGIYFDPTLGLVDKYRTESLAAVPEAGAPLRILAFNSSRPLFRDNPALRRAVNSRSNRRDLVGSERFGS